MKKLLKAAFAIMVALSMGAICQAQDANNDTDYKIIMGPMIKADESCWVDVHKANEDGKAGELVGYSRVDAGIHENVPILIREVEANHEEQFERYLVEVHEDGGEIGKFEPGGPDKAVEGGWCTSNHVANDPSNKYILGNSWGFDPLSDEELVSSGSEHADVPEFPYLTEEDGNYKLNEKVEP